MNLLKLFSIGGISSALYGVLASLVVALALVGLLYRSALESIANLEASLQIERENTTTLHAAIDKQNKALESLKVQKTNKDTSAVDRITVKDSSCAEELRGYKALFKELGRN